MCSIPSDPINPPNSDSSDNILNKLNDDCLRSIFEASNLDHRDLWQLSNVCHRFQHIAIAVFGTKYKNFEGFEDEITSDQWTFDDLLRTFGKSIRSFGSAVLNDVQCQLALKHCPNVKELKCIILNQDTIDGLRPLIARLEHLQIRLTNAPMCIKDWFGADIKLKKLSIKHYENNYLKLPQGNLPEMVELTLSWVRVCGNEQFFIKNPQLQRLSMHAWADYSFSFDYNCFKTLQNLHSLELRKTDGDDDTAKAIKAIADHAIPIENLYYFVKESDQPFLGHIARMKSIKRLEMKYLIFVGQDQHSNNLARDLPNLVELHILTDPHPTAMSGVRKIMENAGDHLKTVVFGYDVWMSICDNPPDEMAFQSLAMAARQRGIDLQMQYQSAHYRSGTTEMKELETSFVALYGDILARYPWITYQFEKTIHPVT